MQNKHLVENIYISHESFLILHLLLFLFSSLPVGNSNIAKYYLTSLEIGMRNMGQRCRWKAFSKTKLKVRIERCDILACVCDSVQLCQTEILSSLFSLLNDNCWTPNINQHYWKLPKMKLNFIFLSSLCFVEFVVC